jgi:hypothetical protein
LVIPTCTFDLETPNEGTITGLGFLEIFVPIELLLNLSVNDHLVELGTILSGFDLHDRSQERLRVEESVEESNLGEFGRIIFPNIELIKSLLDIIQPGVEISRGWESKFLPSWWDFVHEDGTHQSFHFTSESKLTLEC